MNGEDGVLINDALLVNGIDKMVAGTGRGRLLIYDAKMSKVDRKKEQPLGLTQEIRLIKVAHEVMKRSMRKMALVLLSFFSNERWKSSPCHLAKHAKSVLSCTSLCSLLRSCCTVLLATYGCRRSATSHC